MVCVLLFRVHYGATSIPFVWDEKEESRWQFRNKVATACNLKRVNATACGFFVGKATDCDTHELLRHRADPDYAPPLSIRVQEAKKGCVGGEGAQICVSCQGGVRQVDAPAYVGATKRYKRGYPVTALM